MCEKYNKDPSITFKHNISVELIIMKKKRNYRKYGHKTKSKIAIFYTNFSLITEKCVN